MKKELQAVKSAIKQAGEAAMEYYGEDLDPDTHYKADDSPVTKADIAAQKALEDELDEFGYGMLSEERVDDRSRLEKGKVWIIDPLDGTKDFLQQTGDFTIMVALSVEGEVKLGAVYAPAEDKLYFAQKDEGAYLQKSDQDPTHINVSVENEAQNMKMLVSRNHLMEPEQRTAEKLGIGEMVPCGSAGLKISKIAEGQAHMYINSSDKTDEWDIAAGDIILSEAGGDLTDTQGEDFVYNKEDTKNKNGYLASNGEIHSEILDTLQEEME
ncbi:MAG: 3'(2'),5'-bisphosphate nucleotidase CysQ [Candidatus Magasanikbacteria bacterium]